MNETLEQLEPLPAKWSAAFRAEESRKDQCGGGIEPESVVSGCEGAYVHVVILLI